MNNKRLQIRFILLVLLPIILGLLALIGWTLDIDILKRGIASSVAMNPATAIGFILLGLEAGRLHFRNNVSLISGAGQLAIGVVIIASTLKFSDLMLDTSFHIDTQLFSTKLDAESGHPSRMAPNTAFCFFVSAWAMQFLRSKSDSLILTAQLLMLIPILITLLAVIGYAYKVEPFYGMGIFIPMAFNTAVTFLFFSGVVLFIHPDKGYMCVFTNAGSAGAIASILLPAALFVPFLLGWISLVGQREGFYDTALGHALFVVLVITLLFSIIYIGIRKLFLADILQQKVEAELRDSIAILRAILDNSPFLVWLKNPDGHFITVNRIFANHIGLKDIQQIVGKTDLDIWPKELAEKYRADDAEIMSTRRQIHIEEQAFDNGKIYWVETYKTPIIDEQGNVLGTTGFAIDITERKQVEQKTRALALRNQVLMQTATDGIHIMDEQGNILEANETFCRLLGYTAEEIAHLNVVDWDACWTAEELETMFRESIGRNTMFETVHRRKDGTLFNVEISTSNVELDGQHYFFAASRDITTRKQTEEELRIAAIAFDSQQGMILTDPNGIILRVNKAFTHLTGYSAEEAIGKTPRLLSSGRHDSAFYQDLWENLLEKRYWQGEIWNQRKNGVIYPEWLTISAVPNADGQVTHYVGAFSDITQHKEAEAKIHRLAYYDPLTQLPNRRLLNDRLSQALATSARSGQYGALLFIDLDNFKILNDTLGHDMGDLLLKQVAHRLVTCVREGDTVARVGGDEFVVILEDLGDSSGEGATLVEIIGEKILTTLNHTYQLASHDYYTTTSIGITLFIGHLSSIEELLKRADIAMYHAKTAGRNAIHFFDLAMQAVVTAHATLEADLRRALEKNQFKLYFQMQVYQNNQITGAEVLLRWQHPERGLVPPMEFISLLEETRLILPIGLWVLETACTQLKMWENTTATQHLQLAVNVSARQFHQDDFVEQVCSVLKKTAIKPDRLKLELTESLLLDNIDNSIIKMQMLKEIGVRFSMDDFGTGYSSLAYLTKLPLDQLKIDQSFVRNIGVKPADAVIVQTIIGMADNLGFEVIAEGVETEAQRAFLELHGCSACQGYLFGKPMPLLEFESSFNDFD